MTNLAGKTALITGSTSGIGLGIATELAKAGVNIILNGMGNAEEIEATRAKLASDYNVRVLYNGADLSRPDQIKIMCDKIVEHTDGVDILVNNAGIQHVAPLVDFPEEKYEAIIAINMNSIFYTMKYCLPVMQKKGWGRVINIASAHGLVASPFKSAYVAAKHGVVGMSKAAALEVAPDNITVNTICPGYVLTPLVENQIRDQAKVHNLPEDEVIEKIILAPQAIKKFASIDDVAAMTLFLCGDHAQSITGSQFSIDGGWTAR
jgi:3-hydroxybutyrate dehydrogenase